MLPIPDGARIFLYGSPVDLRNGFDGLSFLAASSFEKEMSSNSIFVFFNPRRTRIKVLSLDGENLMIWYLRSCKGVFFPVGRFLTVRISKTDLVEILKKNPPKYLWLQNSS